ncbi:LytR/AlgR family response regulator transcription factor [Salmonirosea aquatica]|uniref:Response regulator n=1 Tax=Salmonirosea aquatica TaxID=2654236 RepID=A0A7C9BP98_9BACT|nr:response regulator [Cytophagaceae bacterium SJW1-29]
MPGNHQKISCIAVDDEPIGLSIIEAHAAKIPYLDLRACFTSTTEAMNYLRRQPVDLVFLDIEMPDLPGLEMARLIGTQSRIIFTTAYPDYAVDGFELAAVDYLLKPVSLKRFFQACDRVQPLQMELENGLFVKAGHDWVRVDLSELLYLKADDNYLTFFEGRQATLTRMTLTEALGLLPENQFIRVHKSYIVSLRHLDKIERHQVTVAGIQIPLSNPYRQPLVGRIS